MEKFSNPMNPEGGAMPEQGLAAKLSQIEALVKEVMAMAAAPEEEKLAEEPEVDAVMQSMGPKQKY